MNEQSEKRQIQRFLRGLEKKEVNAFKIYQWIECCHYYEWWDLGIQLASSVPPNSLNKDYHKRLDYLLLDCRRIRNERIENGEIPLEDLIARIKNLNSFDRESCLNLLKKMEIDLSEKINDMAGTRVRGFTFNGNHYEARSHKEVFLQLIQIVLQQYPYEEEKLLSLQGRRRKYFSLNPVDLTKFAERIEGTNIYAELNENANTLFSRGKQVLQLYGMDPSTFQIITDS